MLNSSIQKWKCRKNKFQNQLQNLLLLSIPLIEKQIPISFSINKNDLIQKINSKQKITSYMGVPLFIIQQSQGFMDIISLCQYLELKISDKHDWLPLIKQCSQKVNYGIGNIKRNIWQVKKKYAFHLKDYLSLDSLFAIRKQRKFQFQMIKNLFQLIRLIENSNKQEQLQKIQQGYDKYWNSTKEWNKLNRKKKLQQENQLMTCQESLIQYQNDQKQKNQKNDNILDYFKNNNKKKKKKVKVKGQKGFKLQDQNKRKNIQKLLQNLYNLQHKQQDQDNFLKQSINQFKNFKKLEKISFPQNRKISFFIFDKFFFLQKFAWKLESQHITGSDPLAKDPNLNYQLESQQQYNQLLADNVTQNKQSQTEQSDQQNEQNSFVVPDGYFSYDQKQQQIQSKIFDIQSIKVSKNWIINESQNNELKQSYKIVKFIRQSLPIQIQEYKSKLDKIDIRDCAKIQQDLIKLFHGSYQSKRKLLNILNEKYPQLNMNKVKQYLKLIMQKDLNDKKRWVINNSVSQKLGLTQEINNLFQQRKIKKQNENSKDKIKYKQNLIFQ